MGVDDEQLDGVDEDLFVRLVRHIRANGHEETTIINRRRKEDSYEHRLLNGTLLE